MKMRNSLLCALVPAMLLAGACTDEILEDIEVVPESSSYTVLPLGHLEVPFKVVNAGGPVDAKAVCQDADFEFTALMKGQNNGVVLFIAPDVITEGKNLTVSLTVTGKDSKRTATTTFDVALVASDGISVAFDEPSYSFVADPGENVKVTYEVSGLGYATVSDVKVSATEGWTANVGNDDEITLTVPENAKPSEITLTVTDSYGRTAESKATVSIKDLTEYKERANCFLVKPGSLIRFDASHKGNSDKDEDILENVSAELLWQDVKGLVENVSFDASRNAILVQTKDGLSGNAVVAARRADGQISWSWHLWITDYTPNTNMLRTANKEGALMHWTFMDRDLGATTEDWKSINFVGLYYQWGRKDPFPALSEHNYETMTNRTVYDIDNNVAELTFAYVDNTDNLQNSIKNPTTFYCNQRDAVGDWYTTNLSTHNNNLWGCDTHEKTIYDPCPAGYKVPENDYLTPGLSGVFAYCGMFVQNKANVDISNETDCVATFTVAEHTWYFPFGGRMSSRDGEVMFAAPGDISLLANYWTANHHKTAKQYGAYYFTFSTLLNGGKCNTYEKRASGHQVRCVLDEKFN